MSNSKIHGTVMSVNATKSGIPAARLALYTGKNQDGTYKESTMVDLVGKALDGLAVKDRVTAEVGNLEEVIFDRKNGAKGSALKGFAFAAVKEPKGEAFIAQGNLVADPGVTKNGTPTFRIGVNHKDKDGKEQSSFYTVIVPKADTSGLTKGSFVEVQGQLSLNIGKDGDKVFRDVVAFGLTALEKGAKSAAAPASEPESDSMYAQLPDDTDDDLPF